MSCACGERRRMTIEDSVAMDGCNPLSESVRQDLDPTGISGPCPRAPDCELAVTPVGNAF